MTNITESAVNTEAEEAVKAMKKKREYFKEKYGDRWKSVIYAIANKQQQQDKTK